MKRFMRVLSDAYYETRTRWGSKVYMTLDCRDQNHGACDTCWCSCHKLKGE